MTQGFYSGLSGIQTHQYGLDVVSDNLANISTTGYKGSLAEFSDIFTQALSSSGANTPTTNDIGLGVQLQTTSFQLQQGEMMPSDRFNDLALEGNGWFGVISKNQNLYTRDGHFSFDTYQKVNGDVNSSSARLVTADGMFVSGTRLSNFTYNAAAGTYEIHTPSDTAALGNVNSQGILEFPTLLSYPVEPTTQVAFMGNLGTDDVLRSMYSQAISANNDTNQIRLSFTKSTIQPAVGISWDVVATAESKDGSIVYDTQNGQAIFDGAGAMSSFTIPSINNDGSPVTLSAANVTSINNLPVSGGAQNDGTLGGLLTKYAINADGVIFADFSNGRQSAIGRVAVYHFQNDQGLNREGGSYFQESSNSGAPLFFTDAAGNTITGANVRSGMLEASNVRMEVGLTDMIIMQRAYQANAKTMTTVDEMIQKALQMRR